MGKVYWNFLTAYSFCRSYCIYMYLICAQKCSEKFDLISLSFRQKKKGRQSAISKSTKLNPEQKAKWMLVLTNEFMSSEESSSDDDKVIVHPLPWRSAAVNRMFEKMSEHISDKKSPQAKRLTKPRSVGTPSQWPDPLLADYPAWAFSPEVWSQTIIHFWPCMHVHAFCLLFSIV